MSNTAHNRRGFPVWKRVSGSIMAAGLVLGLTGCGQTTAPPPGNSGGRIDPYRQTNADRYSRAASSVTLLEFADQVTEALAYRIANIPEIAQNPNPVAIELGAITNETLTRTSEFEAIRRRIFLNMTNSDFVRSGRARIYEQPEIMDEQAERFASGTRTYGSGPITARYRLEDTFLLQGTFHELTRLEGQQSTYMFDVTLVNLASRQIVFAEQMTSKQVR